MKVLGRLLAISKEKVAEFQGKEYRVFLRAIRKWERFNEDLRSSMIDPVLTISNPLCRRRRLDVAMTTSELHQRRRRRILAWGGKAVGGDLNSLHEIDTKRENSVYSFLRRYSLGTRVDDNVLDAILQSGSSELSASSAGVLLVKRPLSIKALLGYLYKPGSQRVVSTSTKNKWYVIKYFLLHLGSEDS